MRLNGMRLFVYNLYLETLFQEKQQLVKTKTMVTKGNSQNYFNIPPTKLQHRDHCYLHDIAEYHPCWADIMCETINYIGLSNPRKFYVGRTIRHCL